MKTLAGQTFAPARDTKVNRFLNSEYDTRASESAGQ